MAFASDDSSLTFRNEHEILRIEAWGHNALRVRSTREAEFPDENWALGTKPSTPEAHTRQDGNGYSMSNGDIKVVISSGGKIKVFNKKDELVLSEIYRSRLDPEQGYCSALRVDPREFTPKPGTESWHVTVRFQSLDDGEKIYGMGQYQQSCLNLKGCDLELAHRNAQASVPFALSSLGYGFMWNNPATGRAVFGKNQTTFEAHSTRVMDYWVTVGDSPQDIVRSYTAVTGRPPQMPEYGLGFWQCKLRYETPEQVLQVARKHKKELGLPMDVIVVDFFHWPKEGEWKFDPHYWPDPAAMIAELESMGIKLMVSVWPTVDRLSENYGEMVRKGLLARQDRGYMQVFDEEWCKTNTVQFDATNPAARDYVWSKLKQNYHDKGVEIFWLDQAEPEYGLYQFDNYRYHRGPGQMVGNVYPKNYSQMVYEGLKAEGQNRIVSLVRCAWLGSQKYGTLLWSGDIISSWASLRDQLVAGLNVGLAGIAWWTTDIGGFHHADAAHPAFQELFVRWFQWGAFCPVFRLHGDRAPRQTALDPTGSGWVASGGPNEVWSYGGEVFEICKAYLALREKLRDYVRETMHRSHRCGDPVIRPLFYDFPGDADSWAVENQYMFGNQYLVAPVLHPKQWSKRVYLPRGCGWRLLSAAGELQGPEHAGGEWLEVDSPLAYMPVFQRVAA